MKPIETQKNPLKPRLFRWLYPPPPKKKSFYRVFLPSFFFGMSIEQRWCEIVSVKNTKVSIGFLKEKKTAKCPRKTWRAAAEKPDGWVKNSHRKWLVLLRFASLFFWRFSFSFLFFSFLCFFFGWILPSFSWFLLRCRVARIDDGRPEKKRRK